MQKDLQHPIHDNCCKRDWPPCPPCHPGCDHKDDKRECHKHDKCDKWDDHKDDKRDRWDDRRDDRRDRRDDRRDDRYGDNWRW